MRRSFDYLTEEAFLKAIRASIDEVKEIRQGYADWYDTYPDLAVFGARDRLLNYFDSILYLQSDALSKIKAIFEGVGEVDAREGKIMEQNNLEAEIYRNKGMVLLDCIRPLGEGNQAPYHTLEVLQAKLAGLDEMMEQARYAALYTHYSVDNKWETILEKPYNDITDQEWDALEVIYSNLETEEEKQRFNQLLEDKLKEHYVSQETSIIDKVSSALIGLGVSVVDNVVGGPAYLIAAILDKGENGHFTHIVTENLENIEQSAKSYVSDEKWYYGSKVVGDGVSTVIGVVVMVQGVSTILSGIEMIGAGITAIAAGTGGGVVLAPETGGLSLLGGAALDLEAIGAIAAGVGTVITGAAVTAGGGAIAFSSFNNLGEDWQKFQSAGGSGSYYKKGLKEIPNDWVEVEAAESLKIKSPAFKEFLKSQGEDPNQWRKIVEKWASPDGTIYQRNYWTNGKDYYYHGDGIEVFDPH